MKGETLMSTRLKITSSLLAIIGYIFLLQPVTFAQSQPLFGPNKYTRTTGVPNTYTNSFQACNTGATYKLVVENGEAGKERVSSASISLNGIEIVSENEFNQNVDKIEKV